jgi:hypothetical protein
VVKPRPLEAANISLITIRMMPIDSAWRIPVTRTRSSSAAAPSGPAERLAERRNLALQRKPTPAVSDLWPDPTEPVG